MNTGRSVCTAHSVYTAGCDGCRAAGAERARTRYRLIAYGAWEGMVDAAPARQHIHNLQKAGLSFRAVAGAAQLSQTTVERVARGLQAQLRSTNAQKILAVAPQLAPEALVSSLGASRRLQALMANGWDAHALAPLLGTSANQIRRWRWRRDPKIRNEVHQRIAALFRWIGDTPGPSESARGQARRYGYAPPICWDDDGDLDNPMVRPKLRLLLLNTIPLTERTAA